MPVLLDENSTVTGQAFTNPVGARVIVAGKIALHSRGCFVVATPTPNYIGGL